MQQNVMLLAKHLSVIIDNVSMKWLASRGASFCVRMKSYRRLYILHMHGFVILRRIIRVDMLLNVLRHIFGLIVRHACMHKRDGTIFSKRRLRI